MCRSDQVDALNRLMQNSGSNDNGGKVAEGAIVAMASGIRLAHTGLDSRAIASAIRSAPNHLLFESVGLSVSEQEVDEVLLAHDSRQPRGGTSSGASPSARVPLHTAAPAPAPETSPRQRWQKSQAAERRAEKRTAEMTERLALDKLTSIPPEQLDQLEIQHFQQLLHDNPAKIVQVLCAHMIKIAGCSPTDALDRLIAGEALLAQFCNTLVQIGLVHGTVMTQPHVEQFAGWLQSEYFDAISIDSEPGGGFLRQLARELNLHITNVVERQDFNMSIPLTQAVASERVKRPSIGINKLCMELKQNSIFANISSKEVREAVASLAVKSSVSPVGAVETMSTTAKSSPVAPSAKSSSASAPLIQNLTAESTPDESYVAIDSANFKLCKKLEDACDILDAFGNQMPAEELTKMKKRAEKMHAKYFDGGNSQISANALLLRREELPLWSENRYLEGKSFGWKIVTGTVSMGDESTDHRVVESVRQEWGWKQKQAKAKQDGTAAVISFFDLRWVCKTAADASAFLIDEQESLSEKLPDVSEMQIVDTSDSSQFLHCGYPIGFDTRVFLGVVDIGELIMKSKGTAEDKQPDDIKTHMVSVCTLFTFGRVVFKIFLSYMHQFDTTHHGVPAFDAVSHSLHGVPAFDAVSHSRMLGRNARSRAIRYGGATTASFAQTGLKVDGSSSSQTRTSPVSIGYEAALKCLSKNACGSCNEWGAKLTCGGCKRVAYCSVDCQKLHWKNGHKQECKSIAGTCALCSTGLDDVERHRQPNADDIQFPCRHRLCILCSNPAMPIVQELQATCLPVQCAHCIPGTPERKLVAVQKLIVLDRAARATCILAANTSMREALAKACMTPPLNRQFQAFASQLAQAATEGDLTAALLLGCMHRQGVYGLVANDKKAASLFAKIVDGVDPNMTPDRIDTGLQEAATQLAMMVEKGVGVPQDDIRAFKLYKLAADVGHPFSMNATGFMYNSGTGTVRDTNLAFKYINMAVDNGDTQAVANLGAMIVQGQFVTQDCERGEKLLSKTLKLGGRGSVAAMSSLASIYRFGTDTTARDLKKGHQLLKEAAEYGFPQSQNQLALLLYDGGEGISCDRSRAVQLWEAAAAQGSLDAQENLRRVKPGRRKKGDGRRGRLPKERTRRETIAVWPDIHERQAKENEETVRARSEAAKLAKFKKRENGEVERLRLQLLWDGSAEQREQEKLQHAEDVQRQQAAAAILEQERIVAVEQMRRRQRVISGEIGTTYRPKRKPKGLNADRKSMGIQNSAVTNLTRSITQKHSDTPQPRNDAITPLPVAQQLHRDRDEPTTPVDRGDSASADEFMKTSNKAYSLHVHAQEQYSSIELQTLLAGLGLQRHLPCLIANEFDPESCALATDSDWEDVGIPIEDGCVLRQCTRNLIKAATSPLATEAPRRPARTNEPRLHLQRSLNPNAASFAPGKSAEPLSEVIDLTSF
jgi:TPR repeat protein